MPPNVAGTMISENNAMKEFHLTNADIKKGLKNRQLTFSIRYCMGHKYRAYERADIVNFAKTCLTPEDKAQKQLLKEQKDKLAQVTAALTNQGNNEMLESQKKELKKSIAVNGAQIKESNKKRKLEAAAIIPKPKQLDFNKLRYIFLLNQINAGRYDY